MSGIGASDIISATVGGALYGNLSGGKISFTAASLAHAVAAFLFIGLLKARRFGPIIKPLIVVMFLSVVVCAALTFPDAGDLVRGLLIPRIPTGGAYLVALAFMAIAAVPLLSCSGRSSSLSPLPFWEVSSSLSSPAPCSISTTRCPGEGPWATTRSLQTRCS